MDRRAFIGTLTGAVLAAPLVGEAQPTGKIYRVGLIFTTSPVSVMAGPEPVHPLFRAFVQSLRALGYVEGQNLILERRSAEGRFERLGDIVAELVRLKADVIVTAADQVTRAAKAVTRLLRAHGFDVVAEPESFLVTKQDLLEPQETTRARDWGARLAAGIAPS